jgi:hypothetical protein
MVDRIGGSWIFIAAVALIFVACGKSEQKSSAKIEQTQGTPRENPQSTADSALREWSVSMIEQASAQGVKIDISNQDALAMLLRVYLVRSDLHKGYGAPDQFNLNLLLQWAAGAAVTIDGARDRLLPYANVYTSLAKQLEGRQPITIALK